MNPGDLLAWTLSIAVAVAMLIVIILVICMGILAVKEIFFRPKKKDPSE